jgi:hypothetical protein
MKKELLLRLYFGLAALEGLLALSALAGVSNQVDGSPVWGFSPARLALLAAIGLVIAGFIVMILRPGAETQVAGWLSKPKARAFILFACAILFVTTALILLTPFERMGRFAGYLYALRPLVTWGLLMALQTAIGVLIWTSFKVRWDALRSRKPVLIASGVFLGLLFITTIYIVWSRTGLAPDTSGWNAPGTPVLFSQVLLASGVGIAAILLTRRFRVRQDIFIALALWSIAALVWLTAPAQPTFFSPKAGPPNFQPYPFSDSAYYDQTSQMILNGESVEAGLLRKPLYDFFLAALHVFSGQDYGVLISLQVIILALIPVLVYLLTARIGGRLAGLIAASLVILRERNSIVLTNVIEVSSARLLLSDVPSMLIMLALALLMVRWLFRPEGSARLALMTGAALGTLILIRAQTIALVPIVLVCSLLVHLRRWKLFLGSAMLVILGVALVVFPWMWRNQAVTGQWSVEDTGTYMGMMVGAFADISPQGLDRLPDESSADYDARLRAIVVKGFFRHPERILGFTWAHFMHNEVQSFLHLPLSATIQTPKEYVKSLPIWRDWSAPWPASIFPFLFANLIVLALGLGAAWARNGISSLTPIFLSLGYSLTVAAARFSGWRYILPADWIVIVFYALGLSQIIIFLWALFRDLFPRIQFAFAVRPVNPAIPPKTEMALIGIFVLIGLSLPVSEALIPERYSDLDRSQMVKLYDQQPRGQGLPSADSVAQFLEQPEAVALYGMAVYPRYYRAGIGVGERSAGAYVVRDYNRVGFILLDPIEEQIVLAVSESPSAFPHAEQVLVIGCQMGDHVEALIVVPAAPRAGSVIISLSVSDSLVCPPSAP